MSFPYCSLIFVPVYDVFEIGGGVGRWCRSKPDLDAVKVFEGLPPDCELTRRISAMALVCDDEIEGMNGNILQFFCILFGRFVAISEDRLATKQVNCHPLNRAD